jgi:hypothetical protein
MHRAACEVHVSSSSGLSRVWSILVAEEAGGHRYFLTDAMDVCGPRPARI